MNQSLQQLNEQYGLKIGEAELKFINENHIHPVVKKWLNWTWIIHNVYRLLSTENISSGKARELVSGILEKAFQKHNHVEGGKDETLEAKLRNQLSPIYGLANSVLMINENPEMKQLIIDQANQCLINQKNIDILLNQIESKK